jgi:CHAT domain-containing protein
MWDDGLPETIGLPPADGAEGWPHIINALYRYEYRIIHVAAHGAYHPDDPSHSGILIGQDRYLTAATIDSMPVVPEMVFLNCCHSGRTGTIGFDTLGTSGTAHQLAASVARSLLLLGVRAVVAAGWAVDDEDASNFAGTLYRSLLDDGETFGEAVTAARRAATRTNTWAAYQCYGDPGFRLRSLAAGTDT